ncbi:MAG: phage holin family protein [Thermoanaerobacteraceae bacterium]|nr:phage holin family protein [Thermoanaerobacteraceae bacterium]
MDNTKTIFNALVALVGTVATWLFGGWDLALMILVAFIIIDYLTGLIVAFINKAVDSRIGFRGIIKKTLILFALIVAVLLDRLIGNQWTFRTVVCYFFIGNEGLSILENIGKCGVPLPKTLTDMLQQIKDSKGGNIDG